ncbi:MAG: TldD/PmbA family protein [Elusimicrobia bacterium]|nr:TldD/PmbA family protein [Elusimicrobiota bacterium]
MTKRRERFLGGEAAGYGPSLTGADYGEVFLEEWRWSTARLEDGAVRDIGDSAERGLSLRLLRREGPRVETLFGSSQNASPAAAARLRERLLPGAPRRGPDFGAAQCSAPACRIDPATVPLERKLALLRAIDRAARDISPLVRQVTAVYGDRRKDTRLLNSEGADLSQSRVSTNLKVSVVAGRDGMLQTAMEVIGAQRGYEVFDDESALRAARRAAARAVAKLDAPKAKAGEMAVILAASAGGTFIHEAIGHSLEADHVQEGSSPAYRGMRGKAVAPETITVVDDPTLPFQRGSFVFDDEGVPARATELVKDGVLTDFLYDRATALREGRASNGHGRRESFASRPIPRMSNLYIAPGKDDPAKIIKELKSGLLVTRMGGGQVDTASGEFVFEVDEGWRVENGVVKHLVRDANLLGVGPEALRSIDRVGWDIGWGVGVCGKEGQSVAVSDGQPTIRMPKLVVGGSHD